MTDDNLTIGELGAYTNNSMNREGLKKLVDKVNNGGEVDAYTKAETDALLATKQGTLTAGDNIAISEQNVISASGGSDWIEHTSTNWSDILKADETSPSLLYALKETIILDDEGRIIFHFIKNNTVGGLNGAYSPLIRLSVSNNAFNAISYRIRVNDITGTTISRFESNYLASIEDNAIKFMYNMDNTYNKNKTNLKVYYKN